MVKLVALLLLYIPSWAGVAYDNAEHHVCDSESDIDDMTSGITLAAWWVRTNDASPNAIVAKGTFATGGWEWAFRPDMTQCQGFVVDGTTGNINHRSVTGNCAQNELHHYAVTWDGVFGASIDLQFYYDGVSQSKASAQDGSGSMVTDAGNSLHIAADGSGGKDVGAQAACVAVWDTALTADQISTLAAGGCRAPLKVGAANLRRLYEIHGTSVATFYNLVGDQTCSETGTTATVELGVPFK